MSEEELNKKMEFIVEQQAKFASDMEIMREARAADAKQFRNQLRELSSAVITVVGIVGNLSEAQGGADARINRLVEAQTRTDEEINRLTRAQSRTDERLNIFINVVERFISGNGGAESPA